jgi:hypothetical protein
MSNFSAISWRVQVTFNNDNDDDDNNDNDVLSVLDHT